MEADPTIAFSAPRFIAGPEECDFYHTMDIPGLGLVHGQWDLRSIVDRYLGGVSFANKRVLEIGPASGFLTMEMEKRGADIVAVEVTDDPGWDFVPYPPSVMDEVYSSRRYHMNRIKNSFWFTHAAYKSKAKLLYGDAYNLPDGLGSFDIAVMGALLLHSHSPLRIVEQCARRATTLVIADRLYPESGFLQRSLYNSWRLLTGRGRSRRPHLEGRAICQLAPTRENNVWDTWWYFSTDFFTQFLGVMGFSSQIFTYTDKQHGAMFTVVGTKE
jgi:SAM-dependent methyltransferase